jgi:hypothetical protein
MDIPKGKERMWYAIRIWPRTESEWDSTDFLDSVMRIMVEVLIEEMSRSD